MTFSIQSHKPNDYIVSDYIKWLLLCNNDFRDIWVPATKIDKTIVLNDGCIMYLKYD